MKADLMTPIKESGAGLSTSAISGKPCAAFATRKLHKAQCPSANFKRSSLSAQRALCRNKSRTGSRGATALAGVPRHGSVN